MNGDLFVSGKPRLWIGKRIYAGTSNLILAPDE